MRACVLVITVLLVSSCICTATPLLQAYNVPIQNTSVSGLSSGAYFAVQMHVSYSSIIVGAGVFAGGPYNCAEGSLDEALGPCMKAKPSAPNANTYIQTTNSRYQSGEIDNPANLQDDRVLMFSGTEDTTIKQAVMDSLYTYYENFIPASNIVYENSIASAHTQPTINTTTNPCDKSFSPYLSYCNYDGAGEALNQIYGTLNPANYGAPQGQLLAFDQSEFLADPNSNSVAETGYVYVPDDCANNATCLLHVTFHGCAQGYQYVGFDYIQDAGYSRWADTNRIIVLYPQIQNSQINPQNPNGCWDWWGYNNDPNTYDTQSGVQMNMVYQMIQRITSGYVSIASPTGLKVTSVTNSSVGLSWTGVSGANGYYVLRNGDEVSNLVTSTSYTDTTVQPGTYYVYQVVAYSNGADSAPSDPVPTKTTGTAPAVTAPTNLAVSETTSSSITLSWNPVSGAVGYDVYRNNTQANANLVIGSMFTDNSLESSTFYQYYVIAVNSDKVPGPPSAPITAETASDYVCSSYTDSNYAQVQANRAYQKLGYCYANGSNDSMGLYNTFTVTTLAETSPDYYIVGSC